MFGDYRYANKDIISIREELMEYIKEHDPNWSDYNESSLQLQYVDIVSGVVDLMCYYLDNQALETYLSTARQEKNIKNILSTLNYVIKPMDSAKGTILLTRKQSEMTGRGEIVRYVTGRLKIPKYTQVISLDNENPKYLVLQDTFMPEELTQIEVPVVQGEIRQLFVSNETVRDSYKLYITDTPVPLDYVEITTPGWEKVEDAFLELNGGQKYSVHVDSKDRVYILFTYNWRKYLVNEYAGGLQVQYVESLGERGKVDSFTLTTLGEGVINIDTGEDMSAALRVSNPSPTFGAFDKPNLNEQKANGRLWLQTYNRLITLQDFEVLVKQYPWVRDCYVCDWRTNGRLVKYPHQAKAWVITRDGTDVNSSSQLSTIQEEIQDKTVMMTTIEILPAELRRENWKIGISVVGASDEVKEHIRERVEKNLKDTYLLKEYCKGNEASKLEFGMKIDYTVFRADIIRMSRSIDIVDMPFHEDIQLYENEFLDVESIEVYLL